MCRVLPGDSGSPPLRLPAVSPAVVASLLRSDLRVLQPFIVSSSVDSPLSPRAFKISERISTQFRVINYCSMSNTCLSLDSFLEPPVLSRSPPIQTLWCHQVLLVDETLFLWLFFTNNVLKLSGYFPVLSSFNSVKFGRKIQDNRDKKRGRNNHWMV